MFRKFLTRSSVLNTSKARMSTDIPKQKVTLGLCQFTVTDDKLVNIATATKAIADAAGRGANLIVLPECFNSPYSTDQFANYQEPIPEPFGAVLEETHPTAFALSRLASKHGVFIIGGSIPEQGSEGKIYNTSMVFNSAGTLVAKHRKMHLFDIDIPGKITFQESLTLTPGDSFTTFDLDFPSLSCQNDQNKPDPVKVGLGICYDMRFPHLATVYADQGCSLIVYPAAFNTVTGPMHYVNLQIARALDNQLYIATCSPARNPNSNYQAYGHSTIVDPWAKVVATCEHDDTIIVQDLNIDLVKEVRANIPISFQKRTDLYQLKY